MKKLINRPMDVVPEMLAGLVARLPGLTLLERENVVVRSDNAHTREREVALISGGGSGHEPAHAGYVGHGMLHAAVCGDVFSSPSVDAVLAAVRAVCGMRGALLIVKNYTGDRLNFGLAAELARAGGFEVEMVLVADDVALNVPVQTRRGIAGAVFVHKIAGALAATGAPLSLVAAAARDAAASVGTMGVALGPCIVPAAGTPSFTLGDDEIELGLGIHGEAGIRRAPIAPARELVAQLLSAIVSSQGMTSRTRVALLVNDLGATPPMELDLVTGASLSYLSDAGLIVERVWCGRFLTSLEMPGISLSLMKVDDERLRQLDAPTDAPAWPYATTNGGIALDRPRLHPANNRTQVEQTLHVDGSAYVATLRAGIEAIAASLLQNESYFTTLDQAVGDGDLGTSLARAANAMRDEVATLPLHDPAATLSAISERIRRVVGGTSGPLYSMFLLRAAQSLSRSESPDADAWSAAFLAGCSGISELGGAQLGDRTMLDALIPAANAFAEAKHSDLTNRIAGQSAVRAARAGATATESMLARRGRSQYLGERVLSHPDPGAVAAACWLEALFATVSQADAADV